MPQASINGTVLATSEGTVVVEGNQYFPPDSVAKEYLEPSDTHTTCPWKGEASYYSSDAAGRQVEDAAWYYPEPKEAAANIKDHVASDGSKVTISD